MNKNQTHLLYPLLAVLVALVGLAPTQALPASGKAGNARAEEAIDPSPYNQQHLSIAADDKWNVYAVWEDARDGGVYHIRFAHRSVDGPWFASERVDPTSGDQTEPDIGVDQVGNVYAAWLNESDGVSQVYFATRTAGGGWGISQVISPTATTQDDLALAANRQGAVVVTWSQGASSAAREVFAAMRPAGGSLAPAERVSDTTGWLQHTDVALDDSGRAYAVWQDKRSGNWDIYFATWAPGVGWSTNLQVNDDGGIASQYEPSVAVDGTGTAHAVWEDYRDGDVNIYHAIRRAGVGWGPNVRINDDNGSESQWDPGVTVGWAGGARAVWIDWRSGTGDIYQATHPAGGGWGTNELLVSAPFTTSAILQPPDDPLYVGAAAGGWTAFSRAITLGGPHNGFTTLPLGVPYRIYLPLVVRSAP